jgi:hypothetical protein
LDIAVIDIGLSADARCRLQAYGRVEQAPEELIPITRRDHDMSLLVSRIVKAFLPSLFPGYDSYMWLDADVWIQGPFAIDTLIEAAMASGLAAIPSLDRAYASLYDKSSEHYRWMYPIMADSFGDDVATALQYLPVINSGVFCATSDSAIWATFSSRLRSVHERASLVRDQPAFNAAIHWDKVPFYPLPALFNWLVFHSWPRMDSGSGRLTEPLVPYRELQIVHLATPNGRNETEISCSDGSRRIMPLDYHSVSSMWSKRQDT